MVMVAVLIVCILLAVTVPLTAQEVLLPLQSAPRVHMVQKDAATKVELPFFDDFSNYEGIPAADRWQDGGGYVNTGYGPWPPTIGMLTLDALDAQGNLYAGASTSPFAADTVTSLPVGLGGLTENDSVVFSFYYLPGGGSGNLWERVGDTPNESDSLYLDFYKPGADEWVTVWSRGGVSVDTLVDQTGRDWQYVVMPITDAAYFDSAFRFRFRNHCTLDENSKSGMVGNCDQWNIDYVYLDRGRDADSIPVFRDVAFVVPAHSFLTNYRAMPHRQFTMQEMAPAVEVTITNLYASDLASRYAHYVVNKSGDTLYRYDGGYENAPPFLPDGQYQTAQMHALPVVGYTFPLTASPDTFEVVHVVQEGVAGDIRRQNDTTRFEQVFGNYYAYDDGTPENGYGLTSTASRLYLAYRFDLNVEDTLTAVDMFFNRTRNDENANVPFYISVWEDNGGMPGELLYRDNFSRTPSFDGFNKFVRYVLEEPVLVSGSVYVGFEQANNLFINIGFDRSYNTADRIFYLTGTQWQQSILSGSLMLRPCFGTSATVGVEQPQYADDDIVVFPNPAAGRSFMKGLASGAQVEVIDMMGRHVYVAKAGSQATIELPSDRWSNGVYVIKVTDGSSIGGKIFKLCVKH